MDKGFLKRYNDELQYIREASGEFAAEYPKIAGRLGLDREGKEVCADPFVERLLEGFAFLTARVRQKFDAEFPRFTQSILETVYPHYLSPTPSMLIARLEPDLADGALVAGYRVPRGATLRAGLGRNERTACEYRTAQEVTLWPLKLVEAQYYTRDLGALNLPAGHGARAALRLRLEVTAGATVSALKALSQLDFYIRGNDEFPVRVYEQVIGRQVGVLLRPVELGGVPAGRPLPSLRRVGFDEDQALLPSSPRTFEGYRLLKEYLSFPAKFLFFRVAGLSTALVGSSCAAFDIIVLLSLPEPLLEGRVDRSTFDLYCTPAINLSRRRADRVLITSRTYEYQVIVDRTRALDFEVYRVDQVTGIGATAEEQQRFRPFYLARHGDAVGQGAYFSTHRIPRTLTQQEKRFGKNASYTGSEVYLSLVDAASAPFRTDLRQLAIEVLVTNRHLPLSMAVGLDRTDFSLEGGGPVQSVWCVTGPTAPKPAVVEGELLWRLVSHLSLNYFSLVGEAQGEDSSVPFRELLRLYTTEGDRGTQRLLEGVLGVTSRPVTRRVSSPGPVAFVRGSELTLRLDETAFEGTGIFLFGAVAERFFAKFASINSFTETVVISTQRGEVMRWPIQTGTRPTL